METVHQVNPKELAEKLHKMGITSSHKYREAHAVTAVEEFAASVALDHIQPMESKVGWDEEDPTEKVIQDPKKPASLVLTPSEVAYILLDWSKG